MDDKKTFVSRQIDAQTTALGRRISDTAGTVRTLGDRLQSETGSQDVARLAQSGADAIDRIGRYLQNADADRLVADFEDLAEQRPLTVAGAAFVVGLAISRFLKTSRRTTSSVNPGATAGSRAYDYGSPVSADPYGEENYARA